MRIEIFKSRPRPGEWSPSNVMFTFRPVDSDEGVHCAIAVPPAWMLVGEPEPMLVCRVEDTNVFVTLSATEAVMAAMTGTHGFGLDPAAMPPGLRVPEGLAVPEGDGTLDALPAPAAARNGKARVPARRRG